MFSLPLVPRWLGFLALCLGMFMAILDIQVVVTSLPVIGSALGIEMDYMSWIQTSYLIAEVIAIPLTGLLMRVFSMRWLFSGALAAFTAASIGCAFSSGFAELLVWRVLQGMAGGVLIPLVFSSIFLLFPKGFQQTVATTIGGLLAVMAPALGPITGGWITDHYNWQWLFLINVIPGIVAVTAGSLTLPKAAIDVTLLRVLDWFSLLCVGVGLALLLIGLKEAPKQGWLSAAVLVCFAITALCAWLAVSRAHPAIMFHLLKDRALAFGCALSFLLGLCLFGSVYLMPLFLAFVRGHKPYEIGLVTIVTGVAQLISAPIIVQIDRRFDARLLTAVGFVVLAAGLAMSATQTVATDYAGMFWPQIVRGGIIALCVLPPIRMALGFQPLDTVSEASGLFNVARNIGGSIGIALIDTVVLSRSPDYADQINDLIKTDPAAAAVLLDMPQSDLPAPDDLSAAMGIMDQIEQASLTLAINDCWWMLAAIALLALPLLWWQGHVPSAMPVKKLAAQRV
jgi:MFS transporter, DHA2 family, multidrug resistance protein